MSNALIVALDFDGVICDSAIETGMTGWKAAATLWPDMPKTAPEEMIERFRLLRLIIETGYEAILAMRLLHQGHSISGIYEDYTHLIQGLLNDRDVTVDDLKALFGQTRDTWIAEDLDDWIRMNPLFSGVANKMQNLAQLCPWYIITTKQERFVKQILQANAIELAEERIFGMDRKMSKVDVLKILSAEHPDETIYFVEDRLQTLLKVQQNDSLASVKLFFALWGYNTLEDKALAATLPIKSIKLEDFLEI
jgi:phosphoglycolate phosphatase-like HAD superfamily hydrolase